MSKIPYRPLGLIKTVLENLNFEISHCYEDLIFVNHNAFILRMEEQGAHVSLFFNSESTPRVRDEIANTLHGIGKESGLNISRNGTYLLSPNQENDTIDLHFSTEL